MTTPTGVPTVYTLVFETKRGPNEVFPLHLPCQQSEGKRVLSLKLCAALAQNNMRVKTRQILGNQFSVFTQTNATGLIIHQPATYQGIAVAELR